MTLKDYIADKMPFLITNVILFAAVSGILLLLNMSGAIVFLIFIVWFTPVVTYILVEFIRMGMFHKELSGTLESLDQKYLVAEIMKEPGSAEGRLLYKVLQESNRNMHEHVKSYRERENEYREYIETWVHEIKTPIASTRLIIENNPNQVTRNIQEEVRKIEEYIEQVLYYSRSIMSAGITRSGKFRCLRWSGMSLSEIHGISSAGASRSRSMQWKALSTAMQNGWSSS